MKAFIYNNFRRSRKTQYLLVFFMVLGISFASISQNVDNDRKLSSHPRTIHQNAPLYPRFFINYSYVSPIGSYRHTQSQNGIDFPAMRIGFSFEAGSIFWINKIKVDPKLKFAIYVVYQELGFLFGENKAVHNFNGAKVGPLLSYNPIQALLINIKGTIEPMAIIQNESLYFRGGFGFDIRYKDVFVGLNFSFGRTNEVAYINSSSYSSSFNTSIMRLSFGLNLKPLKEKR